MKLAIEVDYFSCDEGKYDQSFTTYVVNDFVVPGWDKDVLQKEVDRIVALADIESNNDYGEDGFFHANVVNWEIHEDDYVTHEDIQAEKWDREYPGDVRYWSPTIDQETGKVFRKIRGYDGKIYVNNELVSENV